MYTSAENILPKRFDLRRRIGNFSLENSLNLAGLAALRRSCDEVTHLFRQREIRLIRHHENVRNLHGNKPFRDSFAAHQADATCGNRIKASAVVQAISGRLPKNGIHIQKIVPKQLFDGVRFRGPGHVRVIFDAPEIEDQTIGAKLAFHSAKSVGGLVHVSQHISYFIDRMCPGNDQIHVCGLGRIFGDAL